MMKTKNTIKPSVKTNYKYCTRTILKNNEIQDQNYIGWEGQNNIGYAKNNQAY